MLKIVKWFLILSFLTSGSLWGKRFRNQFCEFELPPNWRCQLEGHDWVCQSTKKARQKEAIIVIVGKLRGRTDDLDKYLAHLKKSKTFSLPKGKTQISEVKYAKIREVNGHRWVDSLHLASEVPGFYTRYMATVIKDLGVGATFSVSSKHYSQYQKLFDKMISTLRVFRQKSSTANQFKIKRKEEDLFGAKTAEGWADDPTDIGGIPQRQKDAVAKKQGSSDFLLYVLVAAVLGIVFFKMKKKGRKKS